MPPRNPDTEPALTLEERKNQLLVACTLDRVHLLKRLKPTPARRDWVSQLTALPWFGVATTVAERVLPRKLRPFLTVWRLWSRAWTAR